MNGTVSRRRHRYVIEVTSPEDGNVFLLTYFGYKTTKRWFVALLRMVKRNGKRISDKLERLSKEYPYVEGRDANKKRLLL